MSVSSALFWLDVPLRLNRKPIFDVTSGYAGVRGGYRDEFPYRGIPRYGGPYRDTYRDIPRNL